MDLNSFNLWMVENFQFDCFENEIFKLALIQTFNMVDSTTINGLSFFEYHQKNPFSKFLQQYLISLEFLIKQIPSLNSDHSIEIDFVLLNQFSGQKEHLQSQLFQLMKRYEG